MRTAGLTLVLLLAVLVAAPRPPTSPRDSARPATVASTAAAWAPVARRDVGRLTAAPRAGDLAHSGSRGRHAPPTDHLAFLLATGSSPPAGAGPLRRYVVEVEASIDLAPAAFAAQVDRILADPRSWTAGGRHTLQRVDDEDLADLRVTLATPDTVDALCWPLDTHGTQSCWNEERAVINLLRWRHGAQTYDGDLTGYRAYLVNHEVGHALGRSHASCPGPGDPAPVMLQQTIGLDGCDASPWPFPDAR